MAKNNKLINQLKQASLEREQEIFYKLEQKLIPEIYAGVALALNEEFGWGYERINRAFLKSQKIWESMEHMEMVKKCYEITGINLMTPEQAEELGILKEN